MAPDGLRHAQKGFSLIELLVVVGIVGVLAAVGVPKYQRYSANASLAAGVSYLKQIQLAQEAYCMNSPGNVCANDTALLTGAVAPRGWTLGNVWCSDAPVPCREWVLHLYAAAGKLASCQTSGLRMAVNFNGALRYGAFGMILDEPNFSTESATPNVASCGIP